jgi:hypothetical protein
MALFDEYKRTNPCPARHGESGFQFLNRVDQPYWAKVRAALEAWFLNVPAAARLGLRARFRRSDDGAHHGAFWELYLHEMLRSAGFSVEWEEAIAGGGTPDFLVTTDTGQFYVEATVVTAMAKAERARRRRLGSLYDKLDDLNRRYWLQVEIDSESPRPPRAVDLQRKVAAWLDALDPRDAQFHPEGGFNALPELRWQRDDWAVTIRAIAWSHTRVGRPCDRAIGFYPVEAEWSTDSRRLRKAISDKKRKYQAVDQPLLVAALLEGISPEQLDLEEALFGSEAVEVSTGNLLRQPNGVWIGRRGIQGAKCSAVLFATNLDPWSVTRNVPRVWHHPRPIHPLVADLPWPQIRIGASGQPQEVSHGQDPTVILGLPSEWPGPEEPFIRIHAEQDGPDSVK